MSEFGTAQLPKPGDVIAGKYALERIIGQGGMGAVFAARHVKLGHAVAIKVMLADRQNEEAARRFMNEGRASAHIQNDHVVRIFDIDEERGYACMVLELLQGEDLAQVLEEQGRLAPHVAVGYVVQALDGVSQAHALGIVHRDLKPSNLFLARTQSGVVVVKVLDFGISKARGASSLDMAPHQQTSTAAMLGSPLYMSPEQLRSSKNVDARADIWAIGVILYELLTGVVPFEGETLGALFSAILETDAPRVSAKVRDVPAGLDAIIMRCLQRRPEDRFPSVADLARELAPFTTAQPSAIPLMMTAAMPPPMAPPGARVSAGMPGSMGSPAAGTGYGVMAQSQAQAQSQSQSAASAPGSNPQLFAPGTVPLGAVTPQPYRQTGNTWQSTGSGTRPKSSVGVILTLCGFALVGIVGIGLFVASRLPGHVANTQGSAAGSTTSAAPPPVADPPPVASAVASTPATPVSVATTPAGAAVGTTTTPVTTTTAVAATPSPKHPAGTTPAPAKVEPKPVIPDGVAKVDPPHPPPPPPPTPPTHTAPASTPATGTLQGAR